MKFEGYFIACFIFFNRAKDDPCKNHNYMQCDCSLEIAN